MSKIIPIYRALRPYIADDLTSIIFTYLYNDEKDDSSCLFCNLLTPAHTSEECKIVDGCNYQAYNCCECDSKNIYWYMRKCQDETYCYECGVNDGDLRRLKCCRCKREGGKLYYYDYDWRCQECLENYIK
jgi:hypothetical protein